MAYHNNVGVADTLNNSRPKRQMTISWNDYLRSQFAAERDYSALESLPFEVLELVLEELHSNSVCGLQAFACVSRICRALASPYFHRTLKVGFGEIPVDRGFTAVCLSAVDDFKTLKIHNSFGWPDVFYPHITTVLSGDQSYQSVEYVRNRERPGFHDLSATALDVLNGCCPLVSKLTIELEHVTQYYAAADLANKEASQERGIIDALAEFPNLRHLQIHFALREHELEFAHQDQGCKAVGQLYQAIQNKRHGMRVERLDVILYTMPKKLGGFIDGNLQMTMTCRIIESGEAKEAPVLKCDDPVFERLDDRRKVAERLYGGRVFDRHFRPSVWGRLRGRWSHRHGICF